jgi:hypothetical protein
MSRRVNRKAGLEEQTLMYMSDCSSRPAYFVWRATTFVADAT